MLARGHDDGGELPAKRAPVLPRSWPLSPTVGTKVLVPTDAGPEVAECIWAPQWVDEDVAGLPVCAGLADHQDLSRDESNRARRAEARVTSRRLIRQHELAMKIIAVDYLDQ